MNASAFIFFCRIVIFAKFDTNFVLFLLKIVKIVGKIHLCLL